MSRSSIIHKYPSMSHLLRESISGDEISYLVSIPNLPIITYKELMMMNSRDWDRIINKYGLLVLLYQSSPSYGHWTVIIKNKSSHGRISYQFFDSYGIIPDDELKWHNMYTNLFSNRLSELLSTSKGSVYYNQYRYQGKPPIATCGKHVIVRILHSNMTTEEYNKYIMYTCEKNKLSPDELVCIIIEGLRQERNFL